MTKKCVTTGGGNTGKPCVFPFIYNGKKHNNCAWRKAERKPWCSTKVVNGRHVAHQAEWGYCSLECINQRKRIKKGGKYLKL